MEDSIDNLIEASKGPINLEKALSEFLTKHNLDSGAIIVKKDGMIGTCTGLNFPDSYTDRDILDETEFYVFLTSLNSMICNMNRNDAIVLANLITNSSLDPLYIKSIQKNEISILGITKIYMEAFNRVNKDQSQDQDQKPE